MKSAWVNELPLVLWAHHTTTKISIGKTFFALTFGMKTIILAEVKVHNYQVEAYDKAKDIENEEALLVNLDLLEEQCNEAYVRLTAQKNYGFLIL